MFFLAPPTEAVNPNLNAMDISSEQISEKPKKVGTLKGRPVFSMRTKGGLYMLVAPKGQSFETLGTGPHRGVARHIAQKHEPDVVWTDLSKADHVPIEHFEFVLPEYEDLTNRIRKLQNA